MNIKRLVIIVVITLLASGNIFFGVIYFIQRAEAHELAQCNETSELSQKVLIFSKLFVEKILKGSGEVSFDDRLKLENSIREINDQQIFDQWQNFTKSKSNYDAQAQAANLFTMLFSKIIK